jgi:acetylornithine deacetylase/succinyl-diaminopimelate desuccinylase-like protein
MKEILGTLVEFPTDTRNRAANNAELAYISEYLEACGMFVQPYEFDGFRSMVATTRPGAKDSKVMLAVHNDTVPVTERPAILSYKDTETAFYGHLDPVTLKHLGGARVLAASALHACKIEDPAAPASTYVPRQVGDRLYGRGMLDMEFATATNLSIIRDLADEGVLDKYDIALVFTTDEEIGGYNGTDRLLQVGYRPEVCILPDGGDNWQMQTSSKGFLHYRVATTGRTAHSRAPWEGDNAILKATSLMNEIQRLFPSMGEDTDTSSPNMFIGGVAVNQVPDRAEIDFDSRFVNIESMRKLQSQIGKLCMQHEAELTILSRGVPANFDLHGKYLAPFARLVTDVTGIDVTGSKTLGSSDARFFAAEGIPVISLYPTGGGHHSSNEWISEEALYQYKTVVRRYLDEVARTPVIVTS